MRCVRPLFNVQIFQKRTGHYSTAVIILLHLFFVDASAGGLTQRTHLPVRPYITHRGKHPRRGKHHASRETHTSQVWAGGSFDTSARFGMHPIEQAEMVAM